MGCDATPKPHLFGSMISIHAPTWGATQHSLPPRRIVGISIHAPTWGATQRIWSIIRYSYISIHAPTWGATQNSPENADALKFQSTHPRGVRHRNRIPRTRSPYFNPRTHVGCDIRSLASYASLVSFQSTHPRGVRRIVDSPVQGNLLFQSTHPRGVRLLSHQMVGF